MKKTTLLLLALLALAAVGHAAPDDSGTTVFVGVKGKNSYHQAI